MDLWGDFKEAHPNAEIEDFCLYYLSLKKQNKNSGESFDGFKPARSHSTLAKLIGWINRLQMFYINSAFNNSPIKNYDEFLLLSAISSLKEPKKTEVIYFNFLELSTGLNLLSNLKAHDYIIEYDDATDKRSKRVKLTAKGESVLAECYKRIELVTSVVFNDIPEEDIQLCLLLLKGIEVKFADLWPHHKNYPFAEIYNEICGKKIENL